MSETVLPAAALSARHQSVATDPRVQVAVFTGTIFLSALLLFSVQPMFAKMVLPKLGGAPAVWAISMCFFQAVLLAGYCYAHAITRLLTPARAVQYHLTLLALTCFVLPIGLPGSLGEPPAGDAYLWTLGVLALGVGVPFFAIAGNAPLLQAWFARTGHAAGRDPYFLYVASNTGSLLALLAYPLLIEPSLGLAFQSRSWTMGFCLLCLMIGASAAVMLRAMGSKAGERVAAAAVTPVAHTVVTHAQRLFWIVLAAVPSGLMVAVTTYISTDIASAPFLWVIPLALFLATFILVFRENVPFPYAWLHSILPLAAVAIIVAEAMPHYHKLGFAAAIGGFFAAALICHRELYVRRPAVQHLTEFYIWMSAGGVIGGMFAALLAPKLFTSILEFKLLLLSALLLRPGILVDREVPVSVKRLAVIAAAGAAVLMVGRLWAPEYGASGVGYVPYLLAGLVVAGLIAIRHWPEHRAAVVLTAIAAATLQPGAAQPAYVERSFFGTHRVVTTGKGDQRLLFHGTTLHGSERLMDAQGQPLPRPEPATYYHASGPMARALQHVRDMRDGQPLHVSVVGLGAGSMACHAGPEDTLTFYEIDPSVVHIARDPKLFGFLSRCAPKAPVVLGDARITLAKAENRALDYLVIDAFSSDSIPLHLLTVEALEMYFSKVKDDGMIAVHISNRHLDLAPALAATLDRFPRKDRLVVRWQPARVDSDAAPSHVVLISKQRDGLKDVRGWRGAGELQAEGANAWTDDYSDILSALMSNLRR